MEVPLGTPPDSPLTRYDVKASTEHRDLSTPKLAVGDVAFDFELPLFDFSAGVHKTGRTVRLSEHRGEKPVALIFGSYT